MKTILDNLSYITLIIQVITCLLWFYAAKQNFKMSAMYHEARQRHLMHSNALVLLLSKQYSLTKREDGWGMVPCDNGELVVSGCASPEEAMMAVYFTHVLEKPPANG